MTRFHELNLYVCRKDTNLQNLGAAETKLLYILHWIILDAAEECADADYEKGIYHTSPFYYLFSISAITVSFSYYQYRQRVKIKADRN